MSPISSRKMDHAISSFKLFLRGSLLARKVLHMTEIVHSQSILNGSTHFYKRAARTIALHAASAPALSSTVVSR
jgi:hypothetical protein